jgi:hypothetical protein
MKDEINITFSRIKYYVGFISPRHMRQPSRPSFCHFFSSSSQLPVVIKFPIQIVLNTPDYFTLAPGFSKLLKMITYHQ